MADGLTPDDTDFTFCIGNDNDPTTWSAVTPASVTVDAGPNSSDRVTILFTDYTVRRTWLEVTVKADRLGLSGDDVFYFGNSVGETGNVAGNTEVSTTDLLLTRANPHNFVNRATVTDRYDFNRDSQVDTTDILLARKNQTNFLTALKLITPPAADMLATDAALQELAPSSLTADQIAWLYHSQPRPPQSSANETTRETTLLDSLLADWAQ